MKITTEQLKERRAHFQNPLLIICVTVVLFFVSQLLSALLITPFMTLMDSPNIQLAAYLVANFAIATGLVSLAKKVIGFRWSSIGVVWPRTRGLLLVVPVFLTYLVISALLTALVMKLIPGFNAEQTQELGFSQFTRPLELTAAFIGLVVITPLFEELIFRGILFRGLRKRFLFWPAAVLTSALFGLAHLQWNVAIDTFVLGLLLCYLVEKSGSIVPSILLHAAKNGLAFVLLFVITP